MKGINVKKIAAFAGAAVLFGASVAVADVVYGNTQLVDQNGQPTVKVVVGSKAAITDGVAAANIAARIANEAYKSSTLTAALSGQATCSLGTDTATGSCSVVENSKRVVLEVVVPGQIAGTYTFKTLITDTIDKTLANRVSTQTTDDFYQASKSDSDLTLDHSPLRGVYEGQDIAKRLFKIGSSQFSGFAPYSIVDNQAVDSSYTEEQSFWVGSSENAVKYDSGSERDIVVDTYSAAVYSVKFTGNDYGIPICTGDLNTSMSDEWGSCPESSPSRTDSHRVKIKFMGEEWIISKMERPTANLQSTTSVVTGGEVRLAKEAKYGIINVGQSLDAGNFKVRLTDISYAVGADKSYPAIIDILDANDQVIGQIKVNEKDTYTYVQPGTSNTIKIHVYKTAPGLTLNAKWAEMAIFSDEIVLKDGKEIDQKNKEYKVSLLWKNKDWPGATNTVHADQNKSDSLRQIVIYDTETFSGNKYKPGDVYNFPKTNPKFKLTYQGLDLSDADYEPVSITALSTISNLRVATTEGASASCGASSNDDYKYTAKFIEVKASSNAFGGSGALGSYQVDRIYIDPIGVTTTNSTSPNGIQAYSNHTLYPTKISPKVFFKPSGFDCWLWSNLTVNNSNLDPTDEQYMVKFETVGEQSSAYGAIYLGTDTAAVSQFAEGYLIIREDAGKNNTSTTSKVYTLLPFNMSAVAGNNNPFRFKAQDSSTPDVFYKGIFDSNPTSFEPKLVTERGSQVTSVSTSSASFKAAKKVGMPTFQFAFADVAAASSANEYTMKVGDSQVFGGVTVKVKAIDATCGGSFVAPGGQPTCSVDTSGLSAVIKPDNTPSVEVSQPVKLSSKLVVLDSEASAVGPVITVGGPEVNTVTRAALEASDVDFNTTPVVVKEIGNKIVVAGKTAQDTLAAADQFLAGIQRK
ncbi:MAG: S-layer protein [Candidatus Anstonellaceae archaeon]